MCRLKLVGEIFVLIGENVLRLRSAKGHEFINRVVNDKLCVVANMPNDVGGHTPQANGRADQYLVAIKETTMRYPMCAELPLLHLRRHYARRP